MDNTSTKSDSSADNTQTVSLSAKIKRLQIEESLLLQSINKCVPETSQIDGGIDATSYISFSEFKAFLLKTKNSFKEIKLLFQDIKTSTSSKEMLKTLDIDEVKKSTLELENRIKSFKLYLQTELTNLKSAEKHWNEAINENPVIMSNLKRQPRIQTAKYNEIVPSPVKTMMTSPFKCSEVQQFQEFMMNSANRYGGWNEYHHNIFVNHWQKHFGSRLDTPFDEMGNPVEASPAIHIFICDLIPKLQDIREEEILSHIKWYSKYIYLKERQQKAIDKWRSNRKLMKSSKVEPPEPGPKKSTCARNKRNGRKIVYNNYNIDISSTVSDESDIKDLLPQSPRQNEVRFIRKCYSEDSNSNISNVEVFTPQDHEPVDHTLPNFQKPTKQWRYKINSKDNIIATNEINVENIKKLCIPVWRAGLS